MIPALAAAARNTRNAAAAREFGSPRSRSALRREAVSPLDWPHRFGVIYCELLLAGRLRQAARVPD
jgi:hypothetical protein